MNLEKKRKIARRISSLRNDFRLAPSEGAAVQIDEVCICRTRVGDIDVLQPLYTTQSDERALIVTVDEDVTRALVRDPATGAVQRRFTTVFRDNFSKTKQAKAKLNGANPGHDWIQVSQLH